MAESDADPTVTLVLAFLSLCVTICGCAACCRKRSKSAQHSNDDTLEANRHALRAPLMPVETPQLDRAQVSFKHAAEGSNKCAFCGFENLRRFLFCRLCTSALERPRTPASSAASTQTDEQQLLIRESRRPLQTLNVRQRKVRAKLRLEWQRKLDVAGNLFWFRDALDGFNTAATRFPGFTLRFERHDSALGLATSASRAGSAKTITIETAQSKEQVVEALNLEVVLADVQLREASLANPALLPLDDGHHGSLHWRQVLELAALGFLTKYACFATTAAGLLVPAHEQRIQLTVTRSSLFDDSMAALAAIPRSSIRSALHVTFIGDSSSSSDAAAQYHEWFTFVNHQLAESVFGVFRAITNTEQTFYVNAHSLRDIGADHLLYYFATGRLVGRALLEGQTLGFHLALPLLKIILGLPVSLSDLEYVDPDGYRRLLVVLAADAAAVDAMHLRFCIDEHTGAGTASRTQDVECGDAGAMAAPLSSSNVVDLIPDGRNVAVSDWNKDEYVNRVFRSILFESVSSQLYAFLKGLYEVVPQELLALFDPEELDYVLCSSDEINLVAWGKRTQRQRSDSLDGKFEIDIEPDAVIEVAGWLAELLNM